MKVDYYNKNLQQQISALRKEFEDEKDKLQNTINEKDSKIQQSKERFKQIVIYVVLSLVIIQVITL